MVKSLLKLLYFIGQKYLKRICWNTFFNIILIKQEPDLGGGWGRWHNLQIAFVKVVNY